MPQLVSQIRKPRLKSQLIPMAGDICQPLPLHRSGVNRLISDRRFCVVSCISLVMELPGFYFDPDKKKYFAITPGTSGSVFLTAGDARLKTAQATKKPETGPAVVHLSQRIALQEAGLKSPSGLTFREDFVRAHLQSMSLRSSLKVDVPDYEGNPVDDARCSLMFAEPRDDSLFAVWTQPEGTSVLARLWLGKLMRSMTGPTPTSGLKSVSPSILNCFPPAAKITDIHSFSNEAMNFIICLSVNTSSKNESYTSLSLQIQLQEEELERSGHYSPLSSISGTRMNFEFPGIYHSCAAAANRFAIGGQKHIKIFTSSSGRQNTIFQGFMNYTSQTASSRVTALRFSAQGSGSDMLTAGTNKGFIHTFDLRSPSDSSKAKVVTCTINHLKQIDENKWILSGHDNTLLLMDQRSMKTPFHSFRGHVNACHKFAVCYEQSLRTISSPGDDCVTRFWSMDSGKLIGEVGLPAHVNVDANTTSHSWLIQSPAKGCQSSLLSVCGQELMLSY